ncbi:MAG: hypothetical protein EA390_10480 [Balneolaceae bacterium]|nr:MAG: hypothetical protein EA390_10480 [Balneolaceae bacterium]
MWHAGTRFKEWIIYGSLRELLNDLFDDYQFPQCRGFERFKNLLVCKRLSIVRRRLFIVDFVNPE